MKPVIISLTGLSFLKLGKPLLNHADLARGF